MDHEPGICVKFCHRHFCDLTYLAKGSRPDILFATTPLAHYTTKWQHWHDVLLVQLFVYLDTTPVACGTERRATDAAAHQDPRNEQTALNMRLQTVQTY